MIGIGIFDLPEDVLLTICKFLSVKDLFLIRNLHRNFNYIIEAHKSILFKRVSFQHSIVDETLLKELLMMNATTHLGTSMIKDWLCDTSN